jgi:hypothetical protein
MNSVIELITLIKQKPAMYIGKNYLSCLKAYLDGWCFRDSDSLSDAYMLSLFQEWVMKKYDLKNKGWCDIILYYSQDECDALKKFFLLFDEWLELYNGRYLNKD